jgi:hypothetical protein
MMRAIAFIISAILLAAALLAAFYGAHTLPLALAPSLLLLGLMFERYVYKPIRPQPPGPGWDQTQERFANPRPGQNVVVDYNPRTGDRRCVAEQRRCPATVLPSPGLDRGNKMTTQPTTPAAKPHEA